MKQKVDKSTRQIGWNLVKELTKKRLKVKEGTHRTLWRVRKDDKITIPMCVTEAISPLGSWTIDWVIAVIVVKSWTEHTIWSVAPVSITQVLESYALLLTTWAEKTGCLKSIPAIEEALDDTTLAMAMVSVSLPWTEESNGELGVPMRARSYWHCSGVKIGVIGPEAFRKDRSWGCDWGCERVTWCAIGVLPLNL